MRQVIVGFERNKRGRFLAQGPWLVRSCCPVEIQPATCLAFVAAGPQITCATMLCNTSIHQQPGLWNSSVSLSLYFPPVCPIKFIPAKRNPELHCFNFILKVVLSSQNSLLLQDRTSSTGIRFHWFLFSLLKAARREDTESGER